MRHRNTAGVDGGNSSRAPELDNADRSAWYSVSEMPA